MNAIKDQTSAIIPNPLLSFNEPTNFTQLNASHITPALDEVLKEAHSVIHQIEQITSPTWDNVILPLDIVTEKVSHVWGIVEHISAVLDSADWRLAYNQNQPRITEFWSRLSQNTYLFTHYTTLSQSAEFHTLTPSQKRVITLALRDFRLGGAELPPEQKTELITLLEEAAKTSTRFSENVLDATQDFSILITHEEEVSGLPSDIKEAARQCAIEHKETGYKFTLHASSYFPVMQYADYRPLREVLYKAYVTRASEFGAKEWDNTQLIQTLLQLRYQEAQLLGYPHFAELSLVPKMANHAKEVVEFLEELAQRAKPFALRDYKQLTEFAESTFQIKEVAAWDVMYLSEKLREQAYAFSEEEVRAYFPQEKVLQGLFKLIETLFSIQIKPDTAPVWHPDVRFFRIEQNEKLIAQFYIDLYARAKKRSGAWMDSAQSRSVRKGQLHIPIAYIICNFIPPLPGKDAFLTHDDVITLFHEFGHGLHHMLTQVNETAISGIHGVEWDAVELPSQFMENFCWEWDVIQNISVHKDSGLPLPRDLFNKMIAAKNFQSGWNMLRQIEMSLFDIELHRAPPPSSVQNMLNTLRQRISIMIPPSFNRFQNTFSHIFDGGYAAGYYSYKWAEVLSADAYEVFQQQNKETLSQLGADFKKEILAVGGSRPAAESFASFRKRPPQLSALLRQNGMDETNTS
jgi:oligopeptidase A